MPCIQSKKTYLLYLVPFASKSVHYWSRTGSINAHSKEIFEAKSMPNQCCTSQVIEQFGRKRYQIKRNLMGYRHSRSRCTFQFSVFFLRINLHQFFNFFI